MRIDRKDLRNRMIALDVYRVLRGDEGERRRKFKKVSVVRKKGPSTVKFQHQCV
jgi:hypothetical protein